MESGKAKQSIYKSEGPWGLLLKMSVPSVISSMIMLIYNMADVFFIGQTQDRLQVAAVSLCGPLFTLLSAIGVLFGNGGCLRAATLLGQSKNKEVRSVTAFCCWCGMLVALLGMGSLLLFQEKVLSLLGASVQTAPFARSYLRIMAIGFVPMLFSQSMGSLLRADGDVKLPMYGHVLGSVSNILLDPVFILWFGWGVRGAAVATVIANLLNTGFLLWVFYRKRAVFSLDPREVQLRTDVSFSALALGFPMMLNTLLTSFSSVLTNRFLRSYGDVYLAANGVTSKIRMVVSMLIIGICMGIQPAVAYYHGARQRDRLRSVMRVTTATTTCIGVLFSLIIFLFRDQLIAAFIRDAEVVEYGRIMILGSMVGGPLQGLTQVSAVYLQGTGSVSMASAYSLLRQVLHVALLVGLHALFGFWGIAFSGSATTLSCAVLGLGMCLVWSRKVGKVSESADMKAMV